MRSSFNNVCLEERLDCLNRPLIRYDDSIESDVCPFTSTDGISQLPSFVEDPSDKKVTILAPISFFARTPSEKFTLNAVKLHVHQIFPIDL